MTSTQDWINENYDSFFKDLSLVIVKFKIDNNYKRINKLTSEPDYQGESIHNLVLRTLIRTEPDCKFAFLSDAEISEEVKNKQGFYRVLVSDLTDMATVDLIVHEEQIADYGENNEPFLITDTELFHDLKSVSHFYTYIYIAIALSILMHIYYLIIK